MKTAARLLKLMSYALLLVISSELKAHADAGVPMLFETLPNMIVALIPIILIEAFILGRKLGVGTRSVIRAVTIANVMSTFVGIPITWVFLVLGEFVMGLVSGGHCFAMETTGQRFLSVTLQAPWLYPYESELKWMIPVATMILLVPFFFASWLIEERIVRRCIKTSPPADIRYGMLAANAASYLLLGLFDLWLLIKALK